MRGARGGARTGMGAALAVAPGAPPPARLTLAEAGDWARGARDSSGGPAPLPLAVGGREGGRHCPNSLRRSRLQHPTPSPPPFTLHPLLERPAGHTFGDVRASLPIV